MTKRTENPIENAKRFEDRIVIIPREEAEEGENFLRNELRRYWSKPESVSVMPVYGAAEKLGKFVSNPNYTQNPIVMSHTGPGNVYIKQAFCKHEPDYRKILMSDGSTLPVVFVDPITETQESIVRGIEAVNLGIDKINHDESKDYAYPVYSALVLVSKVPEQDPILIPNLIAAFWAYKDIWLNGRGPDNDQSGRDDPDIMGVLSPYTESIPAQPYYKRLF